MPSVPLASAARGTHHFSVRTYSKQVIRESQLSSSEAGVPWTGRTKPSVPTAQTLLSIQTVAILSHQRFFAP